MIALLFGLIAFASAYVPLLKGTVEVIPDNYIIVFKDSILDEDYSAQINNAIVNYEVSHKYQHALKGFASKLSAEQLKEVRSNPHVAYVEEDQVMRATACSPRVAVNSWGLTRIAEAKMSLDGFYSAPTTAGRGVVNYIIDTGVYLAHNDFQGRARFGFKATPSWSDTDANGHGTHVASTVAGAAYGVARQSEIVAVKVLGDNGSGSTAGVIAGVDYAIGNSQTTGKPSVINMSLGGGYSAAMNGAVDAAVDANVATVVAAGNSNADACNASPASADEVLSVGSTDIGVSESDIRSYFSNYGPCVDVFGPGSDITAAWIGSPSAIRTISGTSMASPHVAGVAALMRGETPSASARSIQASLLASATADEIDLQCPPSGTCRTSPNLMVWNGCLKGQ